MTIALATRGYLCNLRGVPVPVPAVGGPARITVTEQVPDVTKATTKRPGPPTITQASSHQPQIVGATESPPAAQPGSPAGSAKIQAPTIRKVKKD